jgi:hypothetical protein
MLKRCQVLLTDWQLEYTKFISEIYDVSFSEAVRVLVSLGAIAAITELKPEYKHEVSLREMISALRKLPSGQAKEEVFHRQLSKLYYEARKATEFRMTCKKKKER